MNGIEFISLYMRNFLSYGNVGTTVRLNHIGSTLIVGEDMDSTSNGKRTNGVGKTSIINAIMYGIYDRSLGSSKVDDLVNNINKKHMEVALVFRKADKFYKIHRVRKMKVGASGNWVKLYERVGDTHFQDEDEITKDSTRTTNEEIERIVGMPADMFMRIVVVTANHTPFLDLPANHPTQPCQSHFIARLFNLTRLGDKASVLKIQIKETEQQLMLQRKHFEIHERDIANHAATTTTLKKRMVDWERQKIKRLEELEQLLDVCKSVNLTEQKQLRDDINSSTKTQSRLKSEWDEINRHIKQLTKKCQGLLNEHTSLSDSKCPYCHQTHTDELRLVAINEEADKIAIELQQLSSELETVQKQHTEISEHISQLRSKQTVANIDELLEISAKMVEYQTQITSLEVAENPYVVQYEEHVARKPEAFDTTAMNELELKLNHQSMLYKLLTNKDSFIRKKFISKYIPFLNKRLEGYLESMGMTHKVCFTKDMTAEIHQFGRELPFANLSNGQKARVNFALSLAFRDVVQKMHTPINLCLFDEVLDYGLDLAGVEDAAKLLKRKATNEQLCMYVITHKDVSENVFSRIMTVQMEKGFSRIIDPEII